MNLLGEQARILKFFLSNNLANKIKFWVEKCTAKLPLSLVFSFFLCTQGFHRRAEAKAVCFPALYSCVFSKLFAVTPKSGAGRRDPLSLERALGAEPFCCGCCFGVNCGARLREQSLVSRLVTLFYSAL